MFKREAKIMAGIVMTLILLGLIAGLIGPKIFEYSCENQTIKSYPSLNNKYKAVLFQRDCGAATRLSTQVSILETGAVLPRKGGNIFIADDGDISVTLGSWGGPLVEIKWISHDKVLIEYPKGSRIFLNEHRYKNIQIEYRTR